MKFIVGLGNIGDKYKDTRHNVGFMVVDLLLKHLNLSTKEKFNGEYVKTVINGESVIIGKPHTFMNLSGNFVKAVCDFYNIDKSDVLVIYDDKDIELGKVKLRASGSSGGQNGIKHIMQVFGSEEIKRLKVGIGPCLGPTDKFVLGNFNSENKKELPFVLEHCKSCALDYISSDFLQISNKYNGKI